MKRALQSGGFLLCVAASGLGIYNVMSDNADVERLAQQAACGDQTPCRAQKTSVERTPIAQTFEFVTAKRKVTIRCARSFILAGDYACAERSAALR